MDGIAHPEAAPLPAIPLSPAAAEAELLRLTVQRRDAALSRLERRVAVRDAALDVLRCDTAAVRAAPDEAGLVATVWRWLGPGEGDGIAEQLRRSRLFLPGWYRWRHAAEGVGEDPLAHFVATGLAAGLAPNPFFDPGWYATAHGVDLSAEPALLHYLRVGAPYALPPGPLFDAADYLSRYRHLAGERDLLAFFLREGIDAGLLPEPVDG